MYNGTAINDSATIVAAASAAISGGEFLAAKFTSGKIAKCGVSGESAMGIIIPGQDSLAEGDDVTIQIKDIGYWRKCAAVISAGAELMTDANGCAIVATSGGFILAIALEAGVSGQIIKVQIAKLGYKSGGSVTPLTLAALTDVAITSVADGDAIVYDSASQKYVNKALALDDLSDVTIASPTDAEKLTYASADSTWKNA